MLVNRIISNSNLIAQKALVPKTFGRAMHAKHVLFTPARVKVPVMERAVYAVLLTISVIIVPAWVGYYIPEYQKQDRYVYRGK